MVEAQICGFVPLKMARKNLNGSANATESEKHFNGTTIASISKLEKTDIARWRLLDEAGRQTWHYLETDKEVKAWPQSTADRYHLGLPLVNPSLAHRSLQSH